MISIPHPRITLALFLAAMVVVAFLRPVVLNGEPPYFWPLLTTVLSCSCLFLLGKEQDALACCMRAGFHLGTFAYFLSYPLFSPEEIGFVSSNRTHLLAGVTLIMTICGFELGYWGVGSRGDPKSGARSTLLLPHARIRRLMLSLLIGIAIWLLSSWLFARASSVPLDVFLLKMRRAIDAEQDSHISLYRYLYEVLQAGLFLAAASAYVLLTHARTLSTPLKLLCWLALMLCASVSFLSGSRALFLYSFLPISLTCWTLWELFVGKRLRWLMVLVGSLLLVGIWGAMSAIRDVGFLHYEMDLLDTLTLDPGTHLAGAFNLYYVIATVIEVFPELYPYEDGKSLLALIFGWLPRPLWPDKPYPFGLYINMAQGETLEERSASIAVGLAAEGYANFGVLGALLWGVLMGLACRFGDRYVYNLTRFDSFNVLPALLGGVWAAMIVRGGVPEMFYMGVFIMLSQIILAKYCLGKMNRL